MIVYSDQKKKKILEKPCQNTITHSHQWESITLNRIHTYLLHGIPRILEQMNLDIFGLEPHFRKRSIFASMPIISDLWWKTTVSIRLNHSKSLSQSRMRPFATNKVWLWLWRLLSKCCSFFKWRKWDSGFLLFILF